MYYVFKGDVMDEFRLKKMILQFEKRVLKNQEMRIKFVDSPEKYYLRIFQLKHIERRSKR